MPENIPTNCSALLFVTEMHHYKEVHHEIC